jgi:hypothetical protein
MFFFGAHMRRTRLYSLNPGDTPDMSEWLHAKSEVKGSIAHGTSNIYRPVHTQTVQFLAPLHNDYLGWLGL